LTGAVVTEEHGRKGEDGRERASTSTFFEPGRWEKVVVNSERKER
jgi:hypothetical protein